MDISDPLRCLDLHDGDTLNSLDNQDFQEADDIFKSTFKGSVGVVKITANSEERKLSNEGAQDETENVHVTDTSIHVTDSSFQVTGSNFHVTNSGIHLTPAGDISPDDDDLFSDCRSQHSDSHSNLVGELDRGARDPVGDPATRSKAQGDSDDLVHSESLDHLNNHRNGGTWTLGTTRSISLGKETKGPEEFLFVTVSDPHKVGEGISSYMVYRVSTRTNLKCFRRGNFSVVRRYSDFLGLHEKLVGRYQHKGRIIPPPPEKSIIGATKVKMGSGEGSVTGQDSFHSKANFISLRRAALERFINRVGIHPVLRLDTDFVDFLEAGTDLPRATSTSALSSASVLKMVSRMGETVNKITYKMEESDPWFQEKTLHIEQMESQLRKLLGIVENVVACRRELALSTGNLSVSLMSLAGCEEAHHLSRSIEGLARVEESVEQTLGEQADADCAHLLEMVRDYLALVNSVKDVLGERVKAFHTWQTAVNTLHKKREQRSRMELGGRIDKMGPLIEDVTEWESRVEESQENFSKISQVIQVELELFQHYRVTDLKALVLGYLEDLSNTQLAMVKHWEQFLPQIKRGV